MQQLAYLARRDTGSLTAVLGSVIELRNALSGICGTGPNLAFHDRYCANWSSLPFVNFMKRRALLARYRSAQIRGFKSRSGNRRNRHSLLVAV